MVRISRAEKRRAERERKKQEKKVKTHHKTTEHKKKQSIAKGEEPAPFPSVPWSEESPRCPECSRLLRDEENRFTCYNCGWFIFEGDIDVKNCERCGLPFLSYELEGWVDDTDSEHELCSDCMTAVWVRGDTSWLIKE